jgi:CheY-like chemotaxis protein
MPAIHPSPKTENETTQELEIRSVLVLEDDVEQALLLRTVLEGSDYVVTTVENGVDGLREILAFDFDVILCDMMMPTMPGEMFYLAVSRAKPHLCKRFVFITGHAGESKVAAFLERVKGLVLHKPVRNEDLLQMINRAVERAREE